MKLLNLLKDIKVKEILNCEDFEVQNLVEDSRLATENCLFFAISGNNLDGHSFVLEAVNKGAKAVVVSKICPVKVTQIVVEDTKEVMAIMAYKFFKPKNRRVKVIGVVGTNGKTTTSHVIKNVLDRCGKRCGVIGTLGIYYASVYIRPELTTPSSLNLYKALMDMSNLGIEYCVMELSAHAIYLKRAVNLYYEALIFTNCTHDHLDFFKTFELYESVKTSVFNKKNCKFCVVNIDDKTGQKIARTTDAKCYTYGLENPSDAFCVNVECDIKGSSFVMNIDDNLLNIDFSLIGRYNVYNCMASALVCKKIGIDCQEISKAVSSIVGVSGRAEFIEEYNGADVFIDYAHTPDGIENVLKTFKQLTDNRLIVVFGCGGNRDKSKRSEMGKIAGEYASYVVLTDDNPRFEDGFSIILQIEEGLKNKTSNYICIQNRFNAIRHAINMLNKGDVLLVLGKGAEEYQEIMGVKTEFSDKRAIRDAIALLKAGNL